MSEISTLAGNLDRAQLIAELNDMKPAFVRLGVTGLALFGSRARGDNRADSDIDLLADVDPGRKFSLLDLVAVSHLVEDRFGLPANVFLRRSLDPDFERSARTDETVVFRD